MDSAPRKCSDYEKLCPWERRPTRAAAIKSMRLQDRRRFACLKLVLGCVAWKAGACESRPGRSQRAVCRAIATTVCTVAAHAMRRVQLAGRICIRSRTAPDSEQVPADSAHTRRRPSDRPSPTAAIRYRHPKSDPMTHERTSMNVVSISGKCRSAAYVPAL